MAQSFLCAPKMDSTNKYCFYLNKNKLRAVFEYIFIIVFRKFDAVFTRILAVEMIHSCLVPADENQMAESIMFFLMGVVGACRAAISRATKLPVGAAAMGRAVLADLVRSLEKAALEMKAANDFKAKMRPEVARTTANYAEKCVARGGLSAENKKAGSAPAVSRASHLSHEQLQAFL
jgi:hypothetical protein